MAITVLKYTGSISPAEISVTGGKQTVVAGNNYSFDSTVASQLLSNNPSWWHFESGAEPTPVPQAATLQPLRGYSLEAWSASLTYPAGVFASEAGIGYLSLTANEGQKPSSSPTVWRPFGIAELPASVTNSSGIAINAATSPYNVSSSKSVAENNTALIAAIEAAALLGAPVYLPEMVPASLSLTDQPVWLTGPGGIIQQEGSPAIRINRTLGSERAITEISTLQFGVSLAENVQTLTIMKLAQAALADVKQGDLFFLASEDHYEAHYGNNESAWTYMAAWVPVLGLGLLTTSGEGLKENESIIGHTSGASATLLSVSPHEGGGQVLVFGSFTGTFESGEKLYVGGVEKATCSGTPFLVMEGKLIDTLPTNPRIYKSAPSKCVIETTVEASGNVDNPAVLEASRLPAIMLEGVVDGEIKARAKSAWSQFVEFSGCYACEADVVVLKLPNNATATIAGYGYAVTVKGSTEKCRVRTRGRNLRHGFTTNIAENTTFAFAVAGGLHRLGVPKYNTVYDSVVYDSISAGFDTHPGAYYTEFVGCRVIQTGSGNRPITISPGFQDRSFGTIHRDCEANGCPVGFLNLSQEWKSPIKTVSRDINCLALNYTREGFVQQGVPTDTNTKYVSEDCEAVGDTSISTAQAYQLGFAVYAGNVEWRHPVSRRFNGAPFSVKGTAENVVVVDPHADYTESLESSTGFRFDVSPANMWISGTYTVRLNAATPEALAGAFRMSSATNLTLHQGGVRFIGSTARPLVSTTGAGTLKVLGVPVTGASKLWTPLDSGLCMATGQPEFYATAGTLATEILYLIRVKAFDTRTLAELIPALVATSGTTWTSAKTWMGTYNLAGELTGKTGALASIFNAKSNYATGQSFSGTAPKVIQDEEYYIGLLPIFTGTAPTWARGGNQGGPISNFGQSSGNLRFATLAAQASLPESGVAFTGSTSIMTLLLGAA